MNSEGNSDQDIHDRERSASVRHVYVHVPFCSGKCVYCAFYSEPYSDDMMDGYIEALEQEFRQFSSSRGPLMPETLYVGGGTPSIASGERLKRFLDVLTQRMDLSCLVEFTLEANPATLDRVDCEILRQAGVNRISLGAQSFDDHVLAAMGRRHTSDDIASTVTFLRGENFTGVGLDLIAGYPGVDHQTWAQTLASVHELRPGHVSIYAFSVEPGSAMHDHVQGGYIETPDERVALDSLDYARKALLGSGYGAYEISNYALPGFESVHNLAYWMGRDYAGFGPAAASRLGCVRRQNAADVRAYCSALANRCPPPRDEELVSAATDAAERFVFQFRTAQGATLPDATPGLSPLIEIWKARLLDLAADGLIFEQSGHWILTEQGRHFADSVARDLLPCPE